MAPRSAPRLIVLATTRSPTRLQSKPVGIMPPHVAGEAVTGDPADLCADKLDGAHQRIGQQQRPSHGVAELGAGLGIGGDAAGVVVRGTRDQSRAHDVAQLWPSRLFDHVGLCRHGHIGHRSGSGHGSGRPWTKPGASDLVPNWEKSFPAVGTRSIRSFRDEPCTESGKFQIRCQSRRGAGWTAVFGGSLFSIAMVLWRPGCATGSPWPPPGVPLRGLQRLRPPFFYRSACLRAPLVELRQVLAACRAARDYRPRRGSSAHRPSRPG